MATTADSNKPAIVGLGEVLWDVFPDGPRFGGAPANFACSVAGLAPGRWPVAMVSAVGHDDLGRRARQELEDHGVEAAHVAVRPEITGQVQVTLDDEGHASYEFAENTAWDRLEWSNALEQLAGRTTAVCFGTLGQRSTPSQDVIRRYLRATPADCLRVFDVNLRPPYWNDAVILETMPLANVFKCSDDELPTLAKLFDLSGSDETILRGLVDRCDLKLAALTRGASGALLVDRSGTTSDRSGISTDVIDTVGAGDSFTAALTLGLLDERPLDDINTWALETSAFVCSQPGATPQFPDSLQQSGNSR